MLKDFLRTADLTVADMRLLLDLSAQFKREPYHRRALLQNDTVVLYFNKPSTRTRISFETAVARLGGVPIGVGPNELQLGRGETIEDTAGVMSRYARAVTVRTYSDDDVVRFARAASIPVINALTDLHHPCQSLADLMTLEEKKGDLSERTVAYVGDGNNVVHSLMEACALAGTTLRVGTPEQYAPKPEIVEEAQRIASETGGEVVWTDDPSEAVAGADAVYTDTWVSMGDPDEEREERLRLFEPYQVNADLMAKAAPDAIFMHCLPDHRWEEVTPEVVDGPRSVVFDQAENRLHTSCAILCALLLHRLEGREIGSHIPGSV